MTTGKVYPNTDGNSYGFTEAQENCKTSMQEHTIYNHVKRTSQRIRKETNKSLEMFKYICTTPYLHGEAWSTEHNVVNTPVTAKEDHTFSRDQTGQMAKG